VVGRGDADQAEALAALELVRRVRRHHGDLAGLELERLAVDRERRAAGLDDERLVVGMAVQAGAGTGVEGPDEEGDARAVLPSLEAADQIAGKV
jgi:hypothetical protein